jgi:hypothetical protein
VTLGWLTLEVFKIVLKLKMSTNKHRIDGDEEIDVLHDYESTIYRAKVSAR